MWARRCEGSHHVGRPVGAVEFPLYTLPWSRQHRQAASRQAVSLLVAFESQVAPQILDGPLPRQWVHILHIEMSTTREEKHYRVSFPRIRTRPGYNKGEG